MSVLPDVADFVVREAVWRTGADLDASLKLDILSGSEVLDYLLRELGQIACIRWGQLR